MSNPQDPHQGRPQQSDSNPAAEQTQIAQPQWQPSGEQQQWQQPGGNPAEQTQIAQPQWPQVSGQGGQQWQQPGSGNPAEQTQIAQPQWPQVGGQQQWQQMPQQGQQWGGQQNFGQQQNFGSAQFPGQQQFGDQQQFGSGQFQGQQFPGQQFAGQPDPNVPKKSKKGLFIGLGVGAVVVIAAIVVGVLFAIGTLGGKKFDQAKVNDGVTKVLKDDYQESDVKDVSCATDGVKVESGSTFDCKVTISGKQQTITVKVLDSNGKYEVGAPKL